MKKYYSFLYIILCAVFFSCTNDTPVSYSAGGVMDWQLFDSAYYVSDLESAEGNILFCAGEYGNCYKIQNGVKTRYNFLYTNFFPNTVRYFNDSYLAFANVYSIQYYPYQYYYDTSKIKMISNNVISTINIPSNFGERNLYDFIFLESDKLLIATADSIFTYKNAEVKRIKNTSNGYYTNFFKQGDEIFIIRFFPYEKYVSTQKIINDSAVSYVTTSSASNVWINQIKGKVVRETKNLNGECTLDYLSPAGWINFFSMNVKYFQSIAGRDVNNFYFSACDTSGKVIRKYFVNGNIEDDNFFSPFDSTKLGRNTINGEIYSYKTDKASGITFIYKGRLR